jgi:hypothetical protein
MDDDKYLHDGHGILMHYIRKWIADMNPRLAWQTAVARSALAREPIR